MRGAFGGVLALAPYVAVVGFVYAWQAGVAWAAAPAIAIAAVTGVFALIWIVRRSARAKPDNYVGKFRRPDGTIVHVARMDSGRLWVASDTQPPQEIGYVDGREMMRWEKLSSTPG